MNKFVGVDILLEDGNKIVTEHYGIYDQKNNQMKPNVFDTEEKRDIKLNNLNGGK